MFHFWNDNKRLQPQGGKLDYTAKKKDDDLKNPNHLKKAWSKTGISKIGRNENKRVIHIFLKEHKKHVKTNSEDKR